MKKAVVLGLSSLFLLTGCGSNKVTCSQSLSEAGMKIEAKIIATIKKDKVDNFEVVYNTDSKTTAQMFCTLYKDAKCMQMMVDELYELYKDKGITKIV